MQQDELSGGQSEQSRKKNYLQTIVDSTAFSVFFYSIIFINSIILSIPNYAEIDANGSLLTKFSLRNAIFVSSDTYFLVLFSIELLMKICAYGVIGEGSYFADNWNNLDLLVVIAGWISYGFPQGGSYIIVFRLVRVFRPLKSLSTNPALRKVVTVILSSIPQLGNVAIVACFAFLFFSIAGLQFFSGPEMHARCRLTPFPVKGNWTIGSPYQKHRCLLADNIDSASQFPDMKKSESPWAKPVLDCFWPVDPTNARVCSFTSSGLNVCRHGTNLIPESEWTWCGSNYDGFGNPRFTDWKLMDAPVYSKDLRWGHINFDNVFMAFLVVVEVVAVNNWTELMYMVQGPFGGRVASYFILVNLFGTFVVVNLLLTSIKNTVYVYKENARKAAEAASEVEVIALEIATADEASTYAVFCDLNSKPLNALVRSTTFKHARLLLISLCTLLLAINYNTSNSVFDNTLEAIYFLFTIIFMAEITLTLVGQGLRKFFSSALSAVDFVVVLLSFIEACQYPPVSIAGVKYAEMWRGRSFGMGLLSWRFARVLRFVMTQFKLNYAISFFAVVAKTMKVCVSFLIIFALYVYIVALVGMQLFANKLRFDEQGYPISVTNREAWLNAPDRPRANFDDFFLSVGSVFQIISAEKWYSIMDDLWRSQGSGAAAFAIITLVFGMYVLLFQLLTFIIDDIIEGIPDGGQPPPPERGQQPFTATADIEFGVTLASIVPEPGEAKAVQSGFTGALKEAFQGCRDTHLNRQRRSLPLDDISFEDIADPRAPKQINQKQFEQPLELLSLENIIKSKRLKSYETLGTTENVGKYSPLIFNSLQVACRAVSQSPWYGSLSATMALLSAVQLALDSPFLDPASKYAKVMLILNGVFTAYIGAANIIDILGQGPAQYFSSMWAWGDLAVTVVSVIGLCISNQAMIGVRVVKLLHAIVYMQKVSLLNGFSTTVQAMVGVILDALFVTWFFSTCLIFFALFTVSSLKGQLRSCHGDVFDRSISRNKVYMSALTTPQEWSATPADTRQMFAPTSAVFALYGMSSQASAVCGPSWPSQPCCLDKGTFAPYVGEPLVATSRSYCECWGGSWEPDTIYLFDNVAQAFFTLFQIATTAGWADLKAIVTDATGVDMQPVRDNRSAWIFFFIIFILVGFFLCLNLFIGEVVKSFRDNLSTEDEQFAPVDEFVSPIRGKGLTAEQSWLSMFQNAGRNETTGQRVEVSKRLLKRWAIPDYEQEWENLSGYRPSQRFASALTNNSFFDHFMVLSIVANTIILSMPYFGADETYMHRLEITNLAFAIIFNFELLISVLSKGPFLFLRFSSCFDALVVIGTDLELVLGAIYGTSTSSAIVSLGRMARMLKLARILRLPQLQQLLEVLLTVSPAIHCANVFLFFMVFIFAVIGFKSFAKTAFNDIYDQYANFRSIDLSLLTMFRFLTMQRWNDFMHAAAAKTAGCIDNPPYNPRVCGFNNDFGCEPLNGCGSFGIYPFMIVFMLVVTFCCLSLYASAVVDGLSTIVTDSLFNQIDATTRGRFVGCWLKYDKQASGFISVKDLEKLVLDDDNPFKLFVALKTRFTVSEAIEVFQDNKAHQAYIDCQLRDAIGVLPLAVKLGQGCLACEVFKVLFFSADSQLVDLTAGRKLEIETMKLLNRPDPNWLSLEEYYASLVVFRACMRYMLRKKYRRKRPQKNFFIAAGSMIEEIAYSLYRTISSVSV